MIGSLTPQSKRKRSWSYRYDLPREKGAPRRQKEVVLRGTRDEVEAEIIRIQNKLLHGIPDDPKAMTVTALLVRWLGAVRSHVRAKTFERYSEIVHRHLIPRFGGIQLVKLQSVAIPDAWTQALAETHVTKTRGQRVKWNPRTIRHHHRVLRRALQQAVEWHLIPVNPANAVRPPKPLPATIRILSEEQSAGLLQALEGDRLLIPVLLGVACGLRRGEILALRWEHVHLDTTPATLSVVATLEQVGNDVRPIDPKTRRSRRQITLPAFVVQALRRHRVEQAKQKLVLGSA
jgi:integrase